MDLESFKKGEPVVSRENGGSASGSTFAQGSETAMFNLDR